MSRKRGSLFMPTVVARAAQWGRFTRHCLREISCFDCLACGRRNRVGPRSNFIRHDKSRMLPQMSALGQRCPLYPQKRPRKRIPEKVYVCFTPESRHQAEHWCWRSSPFHLPLPKYFC